MVKATNEWTLHGFCCQDILGVFLELAECANIIKRFQFLSLPVNVL